MIILIFFCVAIHSILTTNVIDNNIVAIITIIVINMIVIINHFISPYIIIITYVSSVSFFTVLVEYFHNTVLFVLVLLDFSVSFPYFSYLMPLSL